MNRKYLYFILIIIFMSAGYMMADTVEKKEVVKEGIDLVYLPDVQKEIRLSESQKTDIEAIVKKAKSDIKLLEREKRQDNAEKIQSEAENRIKGILSADQKNRLAQLEVQSSGIRVLAQEEEGKKLDLSAEQIRQIKEAYSLERQEMFKIYKETPNLQDVKKKLAELREKNNEKALNLLSADQRSKLTGTKFKFTIKRRSIIGQ